MGYHYGFLLCPAMNTRQATKGMQSLSVAVVTRLTVADALAQLELLKSKGAEDAYILPSQHVSSVTAAVLHQGVTFAHTTMALMLWGLSGIRACCVCERDDVSSL